MKPAAGAEKHTSVIRHGKSPYRKVNPPWGGGRPQILMYLSKITGFLKYISPINVFLRGETPETPGDTSGRAGGPGSEILRIPRYGPNLVIFPMISPFW